MHRLKFFLLALVILLSGAALSGLVAWKVVTPPNRETVSAGVLSVPSVLGQTADEVLFFPWPVYDMQPLSPISEDELAKYEIGDPFTAITAMEALGAEFDLEQLVRAQQVSSGKHLAYGGTWLRYVKDFPATLGDEPVLLNYAQSFYNPAAVSWLMRPAAEAELSERQQQEALDKVRDDLAALIWYEMIEPDRNYSGDLIVFLERFTILQDSGLMFYEWLQEWIGLMYYQYNGGMETSFAEHPGLTPFRDERWPASAPEPWIAETPYGLEEILAMGQGEFVDVQFISTPRQIVALFTLDSGRIIGVYYDIQLECYSGLGLSG